MHQCPENWPGLPKHLVQELNVRTVSIVCIYDNFDDNLDIYSIPLLLPYK